MTRRLLLSTMVLLLLILLLLFINNTQAAINESEPKCVDGLMIPCWQPIVDLTLGDKIARGFVYFVSLFYLFIGVSIISDRFMGAIEVITSQEREITVRKRDGEKQIIVVRVWNETVANLTLMALGSSAPEILLSIIEICAKNFQAGDLGPSTIVGSAAYNLYVIIALCVSVIPNGQVRRIKHLRVFFVTATWSVFAYVWLYLILAVISPGVLEVWEGLLTFSFFPLTVFTAYAADQRLYYKYLKKRFRMNKRGVIVQAEADDGSFELGRNSFTGDETINNDDIRQDYINTLKELRKQNPSFDLDTLKRMAHEELLNRGHKSRAFYRIQATRRLMGSGDVLRRISERALSDLSDVKSEMQKEPENEQNGDCESRTIAVVSKIFFDPYHYTVIESCKKFQVRVVRSGNLQMPCSVDWTTEDGSATAGTDYIAAKGTLQFNANESEKFITLEVIDDDLFEQDEHFFVRLLKAKHPGIVIPPAVASVIILDDDHAGVFQYFQRDHELVESVGLYELKVQRCTGARGKIVLPFWTEDGTAKKNKEYEPQEGELVFENNESEKSISLRIIEEDSYEKDVLFYVQLGEPRMDDELAKFAENAEKKRPELRNKIEKLAILGKPRLGDITRAQIRIKESKEFKNTVDKLVQRANASLLIGTNTWKEQFIEAVTVNAGSDDDPDGNTKSPSCTDYVMHFLTLFWKIVFAFVPPTSILRGYLTFFVSIICIGIVTAIIGDVASHFGWTLGIKDSVTAVIFVALGTSVPDTFASKVAAIQDKYADASIGNVTGSNAVNVFLGIGIAWSLAAIYHEARGNQFTIDPGNLAFSVTLFCSGAVITIAVLLIRRINCIGGELGGPVCCKYLTSVILMSLWIFYLIASSLEAYHVIKGF